jgi:hypothetical protein
MRVVFWILCAMLAACASENLYEGFKTREAMRDPLAQPGGGSVLPSYQDYEAERTRLLEPARR